MGFIEIVVDEVIEVEPAAVEAEVAPVQRQVLRDLGDGLRQVALVVVDVAIVAAHRVGAGQAAESYGGINLIAEQTLAGLVGTAEIGRASCRARVCQYG